MPFGPDATKNSRRPRMARCQMRSNNARNTPNLMNVGNIHESTEELHFLETTPLSQTATMTIRPGDASCAELESHPKSDQTVVVLEGELVAEVDGESEIL